MDWIIGVIYMFGCWHIASWIVVNVGLWWGVKQERKSK